MATSEWRLHNRGLHGPLSVPVVVQSISKGRRPYRGNGGGAASSCLFVLPGRQQIRVKVRLYFDNCGATLSPLEPAAALAVCFHVH
jgi:hypothetical protein